MTRPTRVISGASIAVAIASDAFLSAPSTIYHRPNLPKPERDAEAAGADLGVEAWAGGVQAHCDAERKQQGARENQRDQSGNALANHPDAHCECVGVRSVAHACAPCLRATSLCRNDCDESNGFKDCFA